MSLRKAFNGQCAGCIGDERAAGSLAVQIESCTLHDGKTLAAFRAQQRAGGVDVDEAAANENLARMFND